MQLKITVSFLLIFGIVIELFLILGYWQSYHLENFTLEILPGIITFLLFLVMILSWKETTYRNVFLIVGIICFVLSFLLWLFVYEMSHASWH